MRGVSASPLRSFVHTESASARLLVAAVAWALIWANVVPAGYNGFWAWELPVRLDPLATTLDLRGSAINHSGAAAHGWGTAMSTDTALPLGVFSVAARGLPDRPAALLCAS